jgi:hypothetical protein
MLQYRNEENFGRFQKLVDAREKEEQQRQSALNDFRFDPFKVGIPKRFGGSNQPTDQKYPLSFPALPLLIAIAKGIAKSTKITVVPAPQEANPQVPPRAPPPTATEREQKLASVFERIYELCGSASHLTQDVCVAATVEALRLAELLSGRLRKLKQYLAGILRMKTYPAEYPAAAKIEQIRAGIPLSTHIAETSREAIKLAFEQMRRLNMLRALGVVPVGVYVAGREGAKLLINLSSAALKTAVSVGSSLFELGSSAAKTALDYFKNLLPRDEDVHALLNETIVFNEDSPDVNASDEDVQAVESVFENAPPESSDKNFSFLNLFSAGFQAVGNATISSMSAMFSLLRAGSRLVIPVVKAAFQLGMALGRGSMKALQLLTSAFAPGAAIAFGAVQAGLTGADVLASASGKVIAMLQGGFGYVVKTLQSFFTPASVTTDTAGELVVLTPAIQREIYGLNKLYEIVSEKDFVPDYKYIFPPLPELPAPGDTAEMFENVQQRNELVAQFLLAYDQFRSAHPEIVLYIDEAKKIAVRGDSGKILALPSTQVQDNSVLWKIGEKLGNFLEALSNFLLGEEKTTSGSFGGLPQYPQVFDPTMPQPVAPPAPAPDSTPIQILPVETGSAFARPSFF